VIVSAFSEKLDELKENRIIEDLNKNDTFIIICGYGQLAKMFLRQEEDLGDTYVIMDKDPGRVKQAIKDGYKAINDDASRHDVISKFDIRYTDITVLCLTNSDIENIYISLNVKSLSTDIRVIARASNESMHKKFHLAGVDHILTPSNVANVMLRTAIHQPVMYNGMQAILTGKNIANIDEVMVHKYTGLIGKRIADIDFSKYKILFMGVQRGMDGEFIFNPNRELEFEHDDILLMMGVRMSIEYFKKSYIGKQHG
jgi:voltage-gated potassium channel